MSTRRNHISEVCDVLLKELHKLKDEAHKIAELSLAPPIPTSCPFCDRTLRNYRCDNCKMEFKAEDLAPRTKRLCLWCEKEYFHDDPVFCSEGCACEHRNNNEEDSITKN